MDAIVWVKPNKGWILINVNIPCLDDGRVCGVVQRNRLGKFIGGMIRKFGELRDLGTLEILATKEAFSWIKDRRLRLLLLNLTVMWISLQLMKVLL